MARAHVTRQIPYHLPSIGRAEIDAVAECLGSGWLTTGPATALFEQEFAAYVGAQYAIAVNSCTSGLHLALLALGVGPGDEVITTPYTFAATGETIVHTGATPVFVDVEPDGFNINPAAIKSAISPRTRVILPVHMAGDPCNMAEIMHIAHSHGLWVVEDAAHALGASYYGKRIGSVGTITVFSFYATKNLTTGEGGMITTDFESLAQHMRQLSLHGLSRDAWNRYTANGSWRYEICELGYKYNLSDIQASIGRVQLKKFDAMQSRRAALVQVYQDELRGIPGLILPLEHPHTRHAWHLFPLRVDKKAYGMDRDELVKILHSYGVGTSVHFIPLHLHRYYQMTFGCAPGVFPEAEKQFQQVLSLPLYPDLEISSVQYICRIIQRSHRSCDQRMKRKREGVL